MGIADSEIYERVRAIVMEALAVDDEEVTPQARLADDLGAESIDYLDIFFQIEKQLGVNLEVNERVIGRVMNDERFVREGAITDEGMEELRRQLPKIDLGLLEESRDARQFASIFTVEGLVEMVKAKLAQDADTA